MKKVFFVLLAVIILFVPVISNAAANVKPEWPQPEPMPASYDIYDYFYVLFTDYFAGNRCYVITSTREMYYDSTESKYKIDFQDGDFLGVYWFTKSGWYKDKTGSGEKQEGEYLSNDYADAEVIWANKDIEYYDKSGYFFRRTDVDFIANVNIVAPPEGVHDTLNEMYFAISTEFNKLLTPNEIKSIDYKFFINGDKKNILKKLDEAFLPLSVNDRTTHILSFEIMVPVGENYCEIIYYNADGIEIGYGSVEFERLAGFIDADGDGLDDRTGRTSGIRYSSDYMDSTIDKPVKPDDDATAIDWLKYLGEYVGYIFEVFLNSISNFAKNVVSGIGSILGLAEPMFGFIGQFFSSMPVEIRTGFIAMFSVSAFLVIMKMLRG